MRPSAAVRWSSVEADPRAGLTVWWTRGFGGRGHRRACTPWDWWRIVLARTVARSDTQSEFRNFRHRCENPLYQQFGPGYASHALYVAAHATTVALTQYQRDLQHHLEVGARRRQPFVERPIALEVDSAAGMIVRFDAIEQLATGSLAARRINPADEPATGPGRPATPLGAALAAWGVQAHRTLANQPDPADLIRVSRVQALIATTTVVVSAAARRDEIDAGVIRRLTPALENAQLARSRSARRWAEFTTPASRPIRRWLRPAAAGRHPRGRRRPDRLCQPGPDRGPD
jgi:hypothetical protein